MNALLTMLSVWINGYQLPAPLDLLSDTRARLSDCAARCNRKRAQAALARLWYKTLRAKLSDRVAPLADALLTAQEQGLQQVIAIIGEADKAARELVFLYTADAQTADGDAQIRSALLIVAGVPKRVNQRLDALSLEVFQALVNAAA